MKDELWERAVCEELGLDPEKVVSIRHLDSHAHTRVEVIEVDDKGQEHISEHALVTY